MCEDSLSPLRPCIDGLLRTKQPPSSLVLRVEKILADNVFDENQAFRLLLSDSELMIQAVLMPPTHPFIIKGEIAEGCVISIEKYLMKRGKRLERGGEVAYLAIEKFKPTEGPPLAKVNQGDAISLPLHQGRLVEELGSKRRKVVLENHRTITPNDAESRRRSEGGSESDDEFESASIPVDLPNRRRRALRDLIRQSSARQSPDQPAPDSKRTGTSDSLDHNTGKVQHLTARPDTSERMAISISHPLNLVALRELFQRSKDLSRPMRRNYICDIFAVVSWMSAKTVNRPKLPPQRDIRIMDPTVANRPKGVLLTVLAEAESFTPVVGTVALIRRVRTHEWEGLSLKAYEVDCKGREWFIVNEQKLISYGLDAKAMRNWWEERQKYTNLELS